MKLLLSLLGIPAAYAGSVLTGVGSANTGVAAMWLEICSVMPFCAVGTNAPLLVGLKLSFAILMFIGGAAVAVLIYAGIRIIISRGNDEGLSEAKKIATYAVLGIALAILADAIVLYAIGLVNLAAS